MSSWLNLSGNLTANLSSNLSSLTGQISNFTREVLTEGTEEIYDQEAELSIAKSKIRELEARVQNQKNEWDRINKLNEDLREKAESAELQIRAISGEYRVKLEERENEIKQLKQSQTQFTVDLATQKTSHDPWAENDDPENLSQLVGQLQREVVDLHADCKYWKDIANNKQNADADLEALKHEHDEKYTSLQTTYSQKVTKLKKKYKTEFDAWQKEREELQKEVASLKELKDKGNTNDCDGELEALRTSLKIAEDNYFNSENKLRERDKIKDSIKTTLESERLEYSQNLKDKDDIIMSLDDEIRRLSSNCEDKDARIVVLEAETLKLRDCLYSQELGDTDTVDGGQQDDQNSRDSKSSQTASIESLLGAEYRECKEMKESLSHANDENVSLELENNKLVEELEKISAERDHLQLQNDELSQAKDKLLDALKTAELERDAAATERDRIEDSVRELEELRYDISKLESWTTELVEELQLSKEVQDEQAFELESLRQICQMKEEPAEEIKSLRLNVKRLAQQYVELFQQYKVVCTQVKESNERLLKECSLRQETAAMVADFGCQVNVNTENNVDTIESLRAEKAILERTIEGLERRAANLEDLFADMHDRKRASVPKIAAQEVKKKITGQVSNEPNSFSSDDPDRPSLPDKEQGSSASRERAFSPCSVDSQDGSYFDDDQPRKLWTGSDPTVADLEGHVTELLKKIQGYESFVIDMESKERDWLLEKSAMENVIIDLQKKLKHQDTICKRDSPSHESDADNLNDLFHVQVQNRGLDTDLSMADIDELFRLHTVNKDLTTENDTQRKIIINVEQCLMNVVDTLRTLTDGDALNRPEFITRLKTLSADSNSNTLKRLEKLKYLVEVLAQERAQNSELAEKEEELAIAVKENDDIKQELGLVKADVTKKTENISSLLQERESLIDSLNTSRKEMDDLRSMYADIMSKKEQMQSDMEKLQFQIDTNETDDSKEISELKIQLSELKMEKDRLMGEVNARDESMSEQQDQFDSILEQVTEEKDRDLLELQEQQEHIMDLYKKKQKEMELITNERNNAVQKAASMEKDVESLSERLNTTIDELSVRPTQKDVEDKEFTIQQLNEDLGQLEKEKMQYLESASKQIELLEDQLTEQEQLVKQLEIKSLNLETEMSEKNDQLMKKEQQVKTLEASLEHNVQRVTVSPVQATECEQSPPLGSAASLPLHKPNEKSKGKPGTVKNEKEINSDAMKSPNSAGDDTNRSSSDIVDGQAIRNIDEEDKLKRHNENDNVKDREIVSLNSRISQLLLSVEEKRSVIDRLNKETERFMAVIKTKDELLLDLQTADLEDANSDSRRRIISYIRELEENTQTLEEKLSSQEEMIDHFANQLTLMKTDREGMLQNSALREQELSDLNERLENVEARSLAKEHASSVLHHEHQKLLELNQTQGDEIAKLREKIHALQTSLEAKQEEHHQFVLLKSRYSELEKEIAAFQNEQERLLTLIHEKNSQVAFLEQVQSEEIASINKAEVQSLQKINFDLGKQLTEARQELEELHMRKDVQQNEPALETPVFPKSDKQCQTVEQKMQLNDKAVMCSIKQEVDASLPSADPLLLKQRELLDEKLIELSEVKKLLEQSSNEKEQLQVVVNESKQLLDAAENEKGKLVAVQQEALAVKSRELSELHKIISDLRDSQRVAEQQHNTVQQTTVSDFHQRTSLLVKDFQRQLEVKDEELKDATKKIALLTTINDQLKSAEASDDAQNKRVEVMHMEINKLTSLCQERQQEVTSLREQLSRTSNIISASEAALEKTQEDNKQLKSDVEQKSNKISSLEQERAGLQHKVQELETDIRRLTVSYREVEAKAAKDMERLRNHLIEIEEGYTNEALVAQEREESLVRAVNDLQVDLEKAKGELQETSVTGKRQRTELQEQLFTLANQRDTLMMQLSTAQDETQQQANAMNNLQRALEQFQKDKDTQHNLLTEQSRKELLTAKQEIKELRDKERDFEVRINEAKLAVQGVSNLSRQLELKDTENDGLKEQITMLSGQVRFLEEDIQASRAASENKLDKALMRNVVLGYFHTPENKRAEVVYVLGNLLGFSKDEILQVGTGAPPQQRGWVSSILPFGGGNTNTSMLSRAQNSGSVTFNKSFAEAFVSFLEQESTSAARSQTNANKLTALMISDPSASSTPLRGAQLWSQSPQTATDTPPNTVVPSLPSNSTSESALSKPHSNPLLYPARPTLFPAPGQEIAKVHTNTATSALKNVLSS